MFALLCLYCTSVFYKSVRSSVIFQFSQRRRAAVSSLLITHVRQEGAHYLKHKGLGVIGKDGDNTDQNEVQNKTFFIESFSRNVRS